MTRRLLMKIEQRKASDLIPYEQNPRMNDAAVAAVAKSIEAFGFRVPIIVDSDGVIVCGHTRRLAAVKLGLLKVPVHVATDLTPEQVRAYRIADNQTASIAEWDVEALSAELAELAKIDFDLDTLGFDKDALDELLANAMPPEPPGPDVVPEPPADPISKTGDLWLMGEHRLLCGDCTNAKNIKAATDDTSLSLVATDPPYNVKLAYGDEYDDSMEEAEYEAFCRAWFERWHKAATHMIVTPGCKNLARWCRYWEPYHVAPWIKTNTMTNGKISRFWCWEPVLFYGEKWGCKRSNDIFEFAIGQQKEVGDHPCPKPMKLWVDLVEQYSCEGDIVGEPFSGSGTTIIACEQLNRKCYAIEIEPRYVDVAVIRWQNYTGKTATRESDGLTFNECIHA